MTNWFCKDRRVEHTSSPSKIFSTNMNEQSAVRFRKVNTPDLAIPAKDIPALIYMRLGHGCISTQAKL